MGLFSKMELMIMIGVLGSVLLIILFLTVLDFIDEKKEKKKDRFDDENNILKEKVKEEPKIEVEEIEVLDFDEPVIEMKEELDNNVVIETNEEIKEELKEEVIVQEVEEVKEEISLKENVINQVEEITYEEIGFEEIVPNNIEDNTLNKVTDNIVVIENEQEKAKEELAKIERELQKQESFEDTITNFELEQEESAIISYDELIKVIDKLYTQNEVVQYDDGNEPITIDEVIKRFANNEMSFENTANLDKLNREMDKDKNLINVYESK